MTRTGLSLRRSLRGRLTNWAVRSQSEACNSRWVSLPSPHANSPADDNGYRITMTSLLLLFCRCWCVYRPINNNNRCRVLSFCHSFVHCVYYPEGTDHCAKLPCPAETGSSLTPMPAVHGCTSQISQKQHLAAATSYLISMVLSAPFDGVPLSSSHELSTVHLP